MNAQLLVLLTDVQGVFDRPPKEVGAKLIDIFYGNESAESIANRFKVGEKSLQGRGGMGAKVDAALKAVRGGVNAVVIAAGHEERIIDKILSGEKAGTIFLSYSPDSPDDNDSSKEGSQSATPISRAGSAKALANLNAIEGSEEKIEKLAELVRAGSRQLQSLPAEDRSRALEAVADALIVRVDELLKVNAEDVAAAQARWDDVSEIILLAK